MYSVRYCCSNCGHSFDKYFPKGQEACSKAICPKCECLKGERVWSEPDRITVRGFIRPYVYPPKPRTPSPTEWEWFKYDYRTTSPWWYGRPMTGNEAY